jgi:hypothetical protein
VRIRPARPDDAEALERIRIRGWAGCVPARLPSREARRRALLARGEQELAETWEEAILWTLEDNPRTRRFYEAARWRVDGTTGSFERLGVSAPVVRYTKRLSSSTSRS